MSPRLPWSGRRHRLRLLLLAVPKRNLRELNVSVRSLLAVALLVAISACGHTSGEGPSTTDASAGVDAGDYAAIDSSCFGMCLSFCAPTEPATLDLSCPSVVTSALSTGGCIASRCLEKDGGSCAQPVVPIEPTEAGDCHVDLTLAGGFQYAIDVTFVQATTESCCPCTSIGPTQSTFAVDNPSTTCLDAGSDAGPSDSSVDAPTDAPREAVDVWADAGVDG